MARSAQVVTRLFIGRFRFLLGVVGSPLPPRVSQYTTTMMMKKLFPVQNHPKARGGGGQKQPSRLRIS